MQSPPLSGDAHTSMGSRSNSRHASLVPTSAPSGDASGNDSTGSSASSAPSSFTAAPTVFPTRRSASAHPSGLGPAMGYQPPVPLFRFRMDGSSPPSSRPVDSDPEQSTRQHRAQKRRKLTDDNTTGDEVAMSEHGSDSATTAPATTTAAAPASESTSRNDGSSLPPFPVRRPRAFRSELSNTPGCSSRKASLKNNTIVYGITQPPEIAARYPGEVLGDYTLWQGAHLEDDLTEHSIRSGYFDRIVGTTVECGSSRASITSALRPDGNMVESMSNLLGACLIHRKEIASVVAPNNFRPPPRVTLTDTRREAWLSELANSQVPLRRLSKSIPHGVRGRLLLDQCVLKTIPVWRAMWLIKCVGSNELRIFRKRGINWPLPATVSPGEKKWIREWTGNINDTLSVIISDPRRKDNIESWRSKVCYILSLIRQIYEDQLLDKDCFHKGLIECFQAARMPELVTWMAIVTQFAPEMSRHCRRARHLLNALFGRALDLRAARPGTREVDVKSRCESIIVDMIRRQPLCAILPRAWQTYQAHLKDTNVNTPDDLFARIQELTLQNALVDRESQDVVSRRFPPPATAVIRLCDKATGDFDPSKLLDSCLQLIPSLETLTDVFIMWATDPYGPNWRPTYAAARLLRLTHKAGLDLNEQLSTALCSATTVDSGSRERLFRLVIELARSKHFSISRYLQRCMARGASSVNKEHLTILAHLPPYILSSDVSNLAASLCQTANCSILASQTAIQNATSKLDGLFLSNESSSEFIASARVLVDSFAPNVRYAMALHIRRQVTAGHEQLAYPSPGDQMDTDPTMLYAPPQSIITVLELIGDYPLFANVLFQIAPFCYAGALRTIVRCVICHQQIFQAIGVTDGLCKTVLARYKALYEQGYRDQELVLSLIDLMNNIPNGRRAIQILQSQLPPPPSEDSPSVAPSPLSDQVLDLLQGQEVRSVAELRDLLPGGGNVVDETVIRQMLNQLFRVLSDNSNDPEQMFDAVKLLSSIKKMSDDAFDTVLRQWIERNFQLEDSRVIVQFVPWLIAGRLVTITDIVKQSTDASPEGAASLALSSDIFTATLMTPGPEFLRSMDHYYTLRAAQDRFQTAEKLALKDLTVSVLEASQGANERAARSAKQLMRSTGFERVFLAVLSRELSPDCPLHAALTRLASRGGFVAETVCRMLNCDNSSLSYGIITLRDTSRAIDVMNSLSSQISAVNEYPCQLLAQLTLGGAQQQTDPEKLSLSDAFCDMVINSPGWDKRSRTLTQFLAGVSPDLISALYSTALSKILNCITRPARFSDEYEQSYQQDTTAQLLAILDATEPYIGEQSICSGVDTILKAFETITALVECRNKGINRVPSIENSLSSVAQALGIHLRSEAATSVSQEQLVLACFLLAKCLTAAPWNSHPEDKSSTFNAVPECSAEAVVETILVHTSSLLSDDMLSKCYSIVKLEMAIIDDRVEFILGENRFCFAGSQYLITDSDTASSPASTIPSEPQEATTPSTPQLAATLDSKDSESELQTVEPWDTVPDTSPAADSNDTALDLQLFGTRRVVIP